MNKTCSRCKEIKDVSMFYRRTPYRPTEDIYDYYCKQCRNQSASKTSVHNKKRCTLDNCDKANYARTLCREHYDKLVRREKREKK